jgi:hypothetical protein
MSAVDLTDRLENLEERVGRIRGEIETLSKLVVGGEAPPAAKETLDRLSREIQENLREVREMEAELQPLLIGGGWFAETGAVRP